MSIVYLQLIPLILLLQSYLLVSQCICKCLKKEKKKNIEICLKKKNNKKSYIFAHIKICLVILQTCFLYPTSALNVRVLCIGIDGKKKRDWL